MTINTDYWFTIEPYVYVNVTDKCALLYNTLDGVRIESGKKEVLNLLNELLKAENCGVVLITSELYRNECISDFVCTLRNNYMGDIIDVSLSNSKPVQLLPYFSYPDKYILHKKHNFTPLKNVLEFLSEISFIVDVNTDISRTLNFLMSIEGEPTINLVGNVWECTGYKDLLDYLNQKASPKYIQCAYENILQLQSEYDNNFSFRISVKPPIKIEKWESCLEMLKMQIIPYEFIFDISSDEELAQIEYLVEAYSIDKYRLNPIFTGGNIRFFEENVFMSKQDIFSSILSIKDIFSRQAINVFDFGKINVMPNGDVYANFNHTTLGNVYTESLYEIVYKEVDEGKSWFRIRNQKPCSNCVYQWLCPSPSNYELAIGRSNLCHVQKMIDEYR